VPKEWLEGQAWRKLVIPCLFRWASAQKNPWMIPDAEIVKALEMICRETFGDVGPLDISPGVVRIVCLHSRSRLILMSLQATQRLSDSWRSVLGSSAIAIVNSFFESSADHANSNEMRQDFARHQLDLFRFTYRKANGKDKKVTVSTCTTSSANNHVYLEIQRRFPWYIRD
jgi:hypothetical protein